MNKNITIFLIICLLFFLISNKISAQVILNEFYSTGGSSDNPSDWIELYNTSNSEIDLKGWLIKDVTTSSNAATTYEFTSTKIIPAHGFCVQEISNRLNNDGDRILLFQNETQKDCVAYGNGKGNFCNSVADIDAPIGELVVVRKPDGTGSWVFGSATYGYSNTAVAEPADKTLCFIPSPTPSLIPTPTDTIIPTGIPTPTRIPTPTKTPTPKPTIKIVNTPTSQLLAKNLTSTIKYNQKSTGQVLGQSNNISISPSPNENVSEPAKSNLISGAKISLVLGLLFCGIAIMIFTQRFQGMKKLNEKT